MSDCKNIQNITVLVSLAAASSFTVDLNSRFVAKKIVVKNLFYTDDSTKLDLVKIKSSFLPDDGVLGVVSDSIGLNSQPLEFHGRFDLNGNYTFNLLDYDNDIYNLTGLLSFVLVLSD